MAWWGKHRLATGVYLLDERIQHLASSLYIVSVLSVIPLKVKILHPDRYVIILRLIAMDWKIRAKAVGYITFRHFSACVCVCVCVCVHALFKVQAAENLLRAQNNKNQAFCMLGCSGQLLIDAAGADRIALTGAVESFADRAS